MEKYILSIVIGDNILRVACRNHECAVAMKKGLLFAEQVLQMVKGDLGKS